MGGIRRISGQSTLEYVLVLLAFVATIATFAAMWRMASGHVLLERAEQGLSHNAEAETELMRDVACY